MKKRKGVGERVEEEAKERGRVESEENQRGRHGRCLCPTSRSEAQETDSEQPSPKAPCTPLRLTHITCTISGHVPLGFETCHLPGGSTQSVCLNGFLLPMCKPTGLGTSICSVPFELTCSFTT